MPFRTQIYRSLPLWNVVLKRLGIEQSLERAATRIEVLQPEETEEVPPAVSLPGQLDLVRGVTSHDTLAHQVALAKQTVFHHAALTKYTIRDCVVADHGVEFLAGSMRKRRLRRADMQVAPLTEESSAHYCMSTVSHTYFGHFLTDSCPKALLASEEQALLLDINPAWPHAAQYADVFRLAPAPPLPRLVRRLTILRDHGQGSNKRARYDEMRTRIAERFGPTGSATERVFLRRGGGGKARLLAREDALTETLAARGFRIVDMDGLDLQALADSLRHARTVVTVEGSHVNHVHFLAPRGFDLCVLMPDDRTTFVHRGLANAFGGRFGYLVCPREGEGYRASATSILKTLDLMEDARSMVRH